MDIRRQPIDLYGAPSRIRTCDLPLRRGLRYPAVPWERVVTHPVGLILQAGNIIIQGATLSTESTAQPTESLPRYCVCHCPTMSPLI